MLFVSQFKAYLPKKAMCTRSFLTIPETSKMMRIVKRSHGGDFGKEVVSNVEEDQCSRL